MNKGLSLNPKEQLSQWGVSNSLFYWPVQTGCCADELLNASGAKYDLERFGCIQAESLETADLLIVSGAITEKIAPYLLEAYERMLFPKYVMALGACAISGGPFSKNSKKLIPGLEKLIPVDVFIAGNPPRPEAIMYGLLQLREKICGKATFSRKN